ncbi:RHS repeat-associated core domain-containing protein [Dictyobacter aurantiacus]|uniref:RHS repeat-associated core domain-containing protein n=1 Tax=Dictyobacter aurantiacus TaxID=1936993 RepID=A0A401ZMS4_9CHLR|nr:RHS repeat-associated core domain-containing protein [Dictyobacter aurantiacus]GCE08158.1 hypothetical protein KDAU_54870 [Dictyobacter aurantiacus]
MSNVLTSTFLVSLPYDDIQRPVTSTASRSGTTFWSQTRTYDNVGNVINLNTTVPTTINGTKTDSQSFCYDDLNRLVWSGNTGTPTGGNHCGLAPNGTTVGAYQQSYSYDALDRVTNGPSGSETYGTFSYLMPDFLGSTSIALRSAGSVQAVQLFSPFVSTRYSDGTMVTPFNFTGQRLDTQTGLFYYNARYYDATSGRFISADTVETNGSGLDPFAYVKLSSMEENCGI